MTAAAILGGMEPKTFLRDYWQKRPLLVRQAIPGFEGIVDRDGLLSLAVRDDATSRLVIEHPRRASRWERHDGPFGGLDAAMLPKSHWTLLVHGVESLVPGGWELLREFPFIPAARVDDLMVSYAADGGSVGPHDDKYDVFLLQGPGRRRWQISTRGDRAALPGAAIKVLANFVAEDEWLLEPGDMLYLPPGVAHWGVAEGSCFTYSIGFLAPSHDSLVQTFLGYLGEAMGKAIDPDALYEDPDLRVPADPLDVSDAMVTRVAGVLAGIKWTKADVGDFLGRLLTTPKAHARFTPPARVMAEDAFTKGLRGKTGRLTLALPTRGLTRGTRIYLNGEVHAVDRATVTIFQQLVRDRAFPLPIALAPRALPIVYAWYLAGWLA